MFRWFDDIPWTWAMEYYTDSCLRLTPLTKGQSNVGLSGILCCQAAQEQLNIVLRSQGWMTPFGYGRVVVQLYFQRSLLCCCWQGVASSKEQPLFTRGLTFLFCCYTTYFRYTGVLALTSECINNVQNIILRTQEKSTDIHVSVKCLSSNIDEVGLFHFGQILMKLAYFISGFFDHPFLVLWG